MAGFVGIRSKESAMALTAEQLRIAAGIDAKMQELARGGGDDIAIVPRPGFETPDWAYSGGQL